MKAGEPKEPSLAEMIDGVVRYFHGEREVYRRHAGPLKFADRKAIAPYFAKELLDKIKTVTLQGARVPPPPFYLQAKQMSGGNFPDFVHLASITYIDVIVFHDKIEPRTLFHGTVHAAQMEALGLERYVQLYVGAFLKLRAWTAIPMEVQAFKLEERFAAEPDDKFSVEAEINTWLHEGRY